MTNPLPDTALLGLIQAEDLAHNSLKDAAGAAVLHTMHGFHDWYDTAKITKLAAALAKMMLPFQHTAAQTADAYMASTIAGMTGKSMPPLGTRKTNLQRVGITPEGVFGRIADTYRVQQAKIDKAFGDSIKTQDPELFTALVSPTDAAQNRATGLVGSAMQLARRNQAAATMADAERRGLITGYRRVIHPELSKGGTCGLCIASSTRIYHVKELMPMHGGCHCLPVAVDGDNDPGSIINAHDLGQYYTDAGGTSAAALKRTRYQIDEHGELGPVLRPEGEPIRKDSSVRKIPHPKTDAEKRAVVERKKAVMAKTYNDLLTKMGSSEDWSPEKWSAVATEMKSRLHDLELAA